MRFLLLILLAALAIPPIPAQSFQRHHITGGVGVALPRQDLAPYYQNAFTWTVGYGYRPLRYFQVDMGYEGAYNAAGVDDYYDNPAFGALRIRDFQYFIPVGGRLVLPLARGRVQVYGGGGGAYMRYSESLRQPSDYIRISCPVCNARDGFGAYALAGADVALNRSQSLRMGLAVRGYEGNTSGRSVGLIPPFRSNDRWLSTYLYLTFSL